MTPPFPTLIIGYWEFAPGAFLDVREGQGLVRYMSIPEAIWHEGRLPTLIELRGRLVPVPKIELHFETTEDDARRIGPMRERALKRWREDRLSHIDGWTRIVHPQEKVL